MESTAITSLQIEALSETFGQLSEKAKNRIVSWYNNQLHKYNERPSWDNTFLKIAHTIAKRSPDAQTQVGAVIVNTQNHILSVGYNGFVSGVEDWLLPNFRTDEFKDKYDWMLHAELNAILNCEHRPRGAILYCTHHPCLHCLMCIAQSGITRVIYDINTSAKMLDEKTMVNLEVAKWIFRNKVGVEGKEYKND